MILNIHTHNIQSSDAVVSVEADAFSPLPGKCYSVGIHPWNTTDGIEPDFNTLAAIAAHPQVVAIGETGLDTKRGASLATQASVFAQHITIAEKVGKPIVVHMVRTSQDVLRQWKSSRKTVAWAIHGMRGNANAAKPLVNAGFYFSFGQHFNPDTLRSIPTGRILAETDESPVDIGAVIESMATALGLAPHTLTEIIAANTSRFLSADKLQ